MNLYKSAILFLLQVILLYPNAQALTVPSFISHIPTDHYAGVSAPCKDIQTARNSAIEDVTKQILGSINAKYSHYYKNKVSGNPKNPDWLIKDDFSRVASGIVLDIEKNIVRFSQTQDSSGKYISFILVRYPKIKIMEMRRLSKGAHIVASFLSEDRGVLTIKVVETNGITVTLASADIHVFKKNQLAGFYNFCVYKVPYSSDHFFSMALNPIRICSDSTILKINIHQAQRDWKDYLLGTKFNFKIKIKGFDELGRPVSTAIKF